MRLNRELVIQRALKLVSDIGFENLTTRRLGQELGVEGPALYRHFKSKSELFDHMAAAILLPVLTPPMPGTPWDEWLRTLARRSLDAVMHYRDGAKIVALSLPIEPMDLLSKPLRAAGFSARDALYASKLIAAFMVGWQLQEDGELHRTDRHEPKYDRADAFEFALDVIIAGLHSRLKSRAASAKARKQGAARAKTKQHA
jgi:TetR/AcrR family transcriptional regulator, tetracycline repressor protein